MSIVKVTQKHLGNLEKSTLWILDQCHEKQMHAESCRRVYVLLRTLFHQEMVANIKQRHTERIYATDH